MELGVPRRALPSFFYFCDGERDKVKLEHPDFGVGEIARHLGRKWNEADTDTKRKYDDIAEKDKQRYTDEMNTIINRHQELYKKNSTMDVECVLRQKRHQKDYNCKIEVVL